MAALDDPRNECEARAAAAAQEAWGQVVDIEASHMLALGVRPPCTVGTMHRMPCHSMWRGGVWLIGIFCQAQAPALTAVSG